MLKITILYGAIREGRLSIRAAIAVKNALEKSKQASVNFIDIKDYHLPVMEARLKDMENPPENLKMISAALKEADGIIFVTPEYNNSYSGALKNAVDYFTSEWGKKPIGTVCASAGKMGGVNASNMLQLLILGLGAYPMPRKLLVPNLSESFNEQGEPQNEILRKGIGNFVEEFLWFTDAIASKKKQ